MTRKSGSKTVAYECDGEKAIAHRLCTDEYTPICGSKPLYGETWHLEHCLPREELCAQCEKEVPVGDPTWFRSEVPVQPRHPRLTALLEAQAARQRAKVNRLKRRLLSVQVASLAGQWTPEAQHEVQALRELIREFGA